MFVWRNIKFLVEIKYFYYMYYGNCVVMLWLKVIWYGVVLVEISILYDVFKIV